MFRLKIILGGTLRGRNFVNQKVEAKIIANILNKMAHLGMPKSEKLNTWSVCRGKDGRGHAHGPGHEESVNYATMPIHEGEGYRLVMIDKHDNMCIKIIRVYHFSKWKIK